MKSVIYHRRFKEILDFHKQSNKKIWTPLLKCITILLEGIVATADLVCTEVFNYNNIQKKGFVHNYLNLKKKRPVDISKTFEPNAANAEVSNVKVMWCSFIVVYVRPPPLFREGGHLFRLTSFLKHQYHWNVIPYTLLPKNITTNARVLQLY